MRVLVATFTVSSDAERQMDKWKEMDGGPDGSQTVLMDHWKERQQAQLSTIWDLPGGSVLAFLE